MSRCNIGLVWLLLMVAAWRGHAQDLEKVDSLKVILESKRGKARVDVLWKLTMAYAEMPGGNEAALKHVQEAYMISRAEPVDSLLMVQMGRREALILDRLERYRDALARINDVLPVARRRGFEEDISLCLGLSGLIYNLLGEYDKALRCQMEALRIRKKRQNVAEISVTQHNIGFVYYKMENYAKALEYYLQSLKSKQAVGAHHEEEMIYINIALCYRYLGKPILALDYANKGLRLCGDMCNPLVVMDGALVLGFVYLDMKQPDTAGKYLLQCYEAAIRAGNRRYQSESLVALAQSANDEKKYGKALKYAQLSENSALSVRSADMALQTYREFYRAQRGMGDNKRAAFYWDKYTAYKDSTFNELMVYSLVSTQIDFEQERNEFQLTLQEATLRWQQRRNIWIAVIGGLMMILIILLLYDYRSRKQESNVLAGIVNDRTKVLQDTVDASGRSVIEREAWEEKTTASIREGRRRLEVLAAMAENWRLQEWIKINAID